MELRINHVQINQTQPVIRILRQQVLWLDNSSWKRKEKRREIVRVRETEKESKRERERKDKKEEEREKQKLTRDKGFKLPFFKCVQCERPEAHMLRAEDWIKASNPWMKDQKIKNFRLTLDHHAREWYDKADGKRTRKYFKLGFSRYFSTQGRSVKNLHNRWKEFKFNLQTDDIEEFVRDVQETVAQLKYNDEAVGNMIKTCMPMEIHTSVYEVTDLEKIITKVRDIYARPANKCVTADTLAALLMSPVLHLSLQCLELEQTNSCTCKSRATISISHSNLMSHPKEKQEVG